MALVPQALLPGVSCRDGPSALEGRGGTQPGLPVAPAPLHAQRVLAAKRADHQTAQCDLSVPPPLLPRRRARPSLRKPQPGWPPAPPQVLVGSAGRRHGSPFHQRCGACPYRSLAAPRLRPSRRQDELVPPMRLRRCRSPGRCRWLPWPGAGCSPGRQEQEQSAPPSTGSPSASLPSALLGKESPVMCPSSSTRKVVGCESPVGVVILGVGGKK